MNSILIIIIKLYIDAENWDGLRTNGSQIVIQSTPTNKHQKGVLHNHTDLLCSLGRLGGRGKKIKPILVV